MPTVDTRASEAAPRLPDFPTFPVEAVERYRAAGLWGTRTIAQEFRAVASRFADREAVVDRERRLTYAELDANSDAIATGLLAAGLEVGDRVTLQAGNSVGTIELFYGLLKAGLVPVCTLQAHGHHEIDSIATTVGARAHAIDLSERADERSVFAEEVRERVASVVHLIQTSGGPSLLAGDDVLTLDELRLSPPHAVEAFLPEADGVGPDDLAVVQLSGGTSGTPKLIPRLHAEYWYNGIATAERWSVGPEDRIAHLIPIVHNAGVHAALWPAHSSGACLVLDSLARGLDVFRTVADEGVTGMLMASSLLDGADHPDLERAVSGLRWISLSGSAPTSRLFDRLSGWGVTVGQNFGMTEGIVLATPLDSSDQMRRHTVGTPISAYDEIRVVDPAEADRECATGEPGELLVRGPYTIRGYIGAPEHDALVFTPDGFYRTGDVVAAVEVDGVLAYRVEGRIKELINRGGEKVNAAEVESLLLEHPRVVSAAVVAMPDLRLGERGCAYVITDDGAPLTLDEVRTHFAAREVAKFKWPERVETRTELPRTAVGKIAKRLLAEEIAAVVANEGALVESEGAR
ncbi:AMP-binding protein [Aeromicrobium alkaliterrae]|uniref:(2,3-dihydroxybenzoyl)adenylate synthase n=1 Tax=Aeromicrobium alkaliterrae TaxID=302168 RepID=A0ABN2K7M2_9ACTN